jgi:hypothetical protein
MNRKRRWSVVSRLWQGAVTVSLLISLSAASVSVSASQDAVSRLVEAEGVAPIINNEVELAREAAIFAAKRTALEILPLKIDSETIYSMGLQIADWQRIQVAGYVKDYEVLTEGKTGEGYRVRIKAWVKTGKEEEDTTKALLSLKKILLVADGAGSSAIEGALALELNRAGYRYHDSGFVKNNVTKDTWSNLLQRKILSVGSEVFKFMADLVVHVHSDIKPGAKSEDLEGSWFNGQSRVRLFQISGVKQGEPILDIPAESSKLFGRGTGEQALRDVMATDHPNGFKKQIARPVVFSFMKELSCSEVLGIKERWITVRISQVPSEGEFQKFLVVLKHQRGVEGQVQVLSQEGGTYTLSVQCPIKPVYLAYLIASHKEYRLAAHDWSLIEFRYAR